MSLDETGGTPLSRDGQRKRDTALARRVLRGENLANGEICALAERLREVNEFGYARRLFNRIRSASDYADLPAKWTPVKIGQREALATYKDPDLPAGDRFRVALELLDGVDRLEQTAKDRQESLCLRGAVHKRRWQIEGQHADLERSLAYYLRSYELGLEVAKGLRSGKGAGLDEKHPHADDPGIDEDHGYAGINAAFLFDLSAREQATQARKSGRASEAAQRSFEQAKAIRSRLVRRLPALKAGVEKAWWFYATLAEAHFGLGEFARAIAVLRDFNRAHGFDTAGPPGTALVAPWELETFVTQLGALGQLQADLVELLSDTEQGKLDAVKRRYEAEQALREYLGELAPGVERVSGGKIGLGLSGGGFRASLFHIGVLAQLAERDLLRRVEVLSCVSGGSIIGAHYYLEVRNLLQGRREGELRREDYVELVERLDSAFLAGVQTNIRSQVFGGIWSNLRAFLQPTYTTTRRLGELYEKRLYASVADGGGKKPRYLNELFIAPLGEGPEFKPKYDNWRRAHKVPVLVLNATTLNSGHLWQFTASFMGEPPSRIDSEIEGNYRLRRMYYTEAPRQRDRYRSLLFRPFAPPDYPRYRLGEAVAASSCVPGLFEPVMLPDLYEGKSVGLVDGGVYDNQGIASLLEQDCTVMIVSDASGQMYAEDHPGVGRLDVPLRSFSVSMARVRQSQYQELDARRRSGLLKGLAFLHLMKDLDGEAVNWRECQEPSDPANEVRPAGRMSPVTTYGVQKTVQRLIASLRTDLDSFTEVEAFALMASGYRMAEKELDRLNLPDAERKPRQWRFLAIDPLLEPGAGYDDLQRQLQVGAQIAGKVWLLILPLTVLGVALGVALLGVIVVLWWQHRNMVLLTLAGLGEFVLVTVLTLLLPYLVRVVRYRQSLKEIGIKGLVAVVLALFFKLHLLIFDPLFLRRGRLARLARQRQGAP